MDWAPASIIEVMQRVKQDLSECSPDQAAAYAKYAVNPYRASIDRYGQREMVVVVARCHNQALYWEDVEEGFNVSPIGEDGTILEHGCNQDSLGQAISRWVAA